MIIDQYYPDPEGRAHLYKRWRDKDGKLIEQYVKPDEFEPYMWVPASIPDRIIDRTLSYYPGARVDRNSTALGLPKGVDGIEEPLVKLITRKPGDIGQIKRQLPQTWEADVKHIDRYLIDNVKEMPDWKPRVWHFDLEWDPEHDFTTVMAVSDSYNQENVVFCWSQESAKRLSGDH